MYDKSTLSSLLNKSRGLQSILIHKSLQSSSKSKLLSDFNKGIKSKLNSKDIVIISIEI